MDLKRLTKTTRGSIFYTLLITMTLLSCQTQKENIDMERQALEKKIDKTLVKIEDQLSNIESDIENATEDAREELINTKENLLYRESKLEEAKKKVAEATSDTWDETKFWVESKFEEIEELFSK